MGAAGAGVPLIRLLLNGLRVQLDGLHSLTEQSVEEIVSTGGKVVSLRTTKDGSYLVGDLKVSVESDKGCSNTSVMSLAFVSWSF